VGGSVLVGFVIGLVSGLTAAALREASRAMAMSVAGGVVLLLTRAVSDRERDGLERSARPLFIMFGLPAVAISLAVAAPTLRALTLPHRTITSLERM